MKSTFFLCLFLTGVICKGQNLQIIRPDDRVFTTVALNDYVVINTFSKRNAVGQLITVKTDSILVSTRKGIERIALGEIKGMKKTSKFGLSMRRLSPYASVVPILFLPGANSSKYEGRTWGGRFISRAAIIIPVGVGLGLLMNGKPLKKVKRGYTFRVVE
ncbi:hypothetical protein DYU11_23530 [Fibrisoma montanum]|uniref:Uncharacterized protein n=1 Tax=Fibrisoma montanum TaxID=2305895 RepID=A0A418M2J2_9BACT|nr:hypothetical protein [Fibrisoma montanum]RIV19894.1 hypothetical protein DYU11_23530 [Fibrisoma montanum]